jgi:N-acetylmuramoyl-L-alanine amidase
MKPTYYRPQSDRSDDHYARRGLQDSQARYSRNVESPRKDSRRKRRFLMRVAFVVGIAVIGISFFNSQALHAHSGTGTKQQYSKTQTVCLDPGHGGSDPGATTASGDITERDINLTVALQVEQLLEKSGYRVFMTRTSNDVTMNNHDRYTYCNDQHATVMVSIHHNYFSDDQVDYATALFYKDADQALASSILDSVASKLNITNDDIAQFDDGVLSESTMPAALSEGFFITNTDEYNLLVSPHSTRLSDEAQGIATGIIKYLTQPKSAHPTINTNPQVINRDESGN